MARGSNAKPVSLALQGGGAHGAFTWGVLDALLEDGRIDPQAITATSAGAMNAVAFAQGRYENGAEGAREALERFWKAVSRAGGPFRPIMPVWSKLNLFPWMDALNRLTSPYDVNPFDLNPLRDILDQQINFDAVHKCNETQLFIAATNVETGRARIFKGAEVTRDAVLASACLPFLTQAVQIEDHPYWDGGFTGNPALWPLFYADTPSDLVVVHINPLERPGTPKTSEDIMNRVQEITFNASLLAELRAIGFVKDLIKNDLLKDPKKARLRDIFIHSIKADEEMRDFAPSSKYSTDWRFLNELKALGRAAAFTWIDQCSEAVGCNSTLDLNTHFLAHDEQ